MPHSLLAVLVLIPVLGLTAQWLAWRFRLPAIVLLALTGLLIGPGLGWLNPEAQFGELLTPLIKVAVALILFEGGLSLRLHEFREASSGVRRLVFPAVPLAFLIYSLAAHYLGGLAWPVALVFGAIIVVSGPTVIIPLLRQARLKRRTASFLKWEGIINDPIGALLAVLVFQYFLFTGQGLPWTVIVGNLALGLVVAVLLAAAAATLIYLSFSRGWVPEYLKTPIALTLALVVYGLADLALDEAGLLAATLFGIAVGNLPLPSIDEIRRFKESIGILLVSGVFLLLTASIQPADVAALSWQSAALIGFVVFIGRPLAIYLATLGSDMSGAERAFVAWISPRGIVAAAVGGVFGAELAHLGHTQAMVLEPLIFLLIFATVLLHGFSLPPLARRLGLSSTRQNGLLIVGASPWSMELAKTLKSLEVPVVIADASWHRLREIRLSGLRYFFGQVLSERGEEALDLSDIGYVLAATDNDAYNALVCSHFGHEFGRSHVHQLPSGEPQRQGRLFRQLGGKPVFGPDQIYETLQSQHYRGWRLQKTRFSEKFTHEQYKAQSSQRGGFDVLLLRSDGSLVFRGLKGELEARSGDVLLRYQADVGGEPTAATAQNDDAKVLEQPEHKPGLS